MTYWRFRLLLGNTIPNLSFPDWKFSELFILFLGGFQVRFFFLHANSAIFHLVRRHDQWSFNFWAQMRFLVLFWSWSIILFLSAPVRASSSSSISSISSNDDALWCSVTKRVYSRWDRIFTTKPTTIYSHASSSSSFSSALFLLLRGVEWRLRGVEWRLWDARPKLLRVESRNAASIHRGSEDFFI